MSANEPLSYALAPTRSEKLRVGLNLLHAVSDIGGAWNYIASFVRALCSYDSLNSYVAFVTQHSRDLVPSRDNVTTVLLDCDSRTRWKRVLYENTWLQVVARREKLDCMHWFANTRPVFASVPAVVTIHDVMVYADPSAFGLAKRAYLKVMLRLMARSSSRTTLCPVSEATAVEVANRLRIARGRMTVLPFVLDSRFGSCSADEVSLFRARHRLPARYWLYVGDTYHHKNHVRLLHAYASLLRSRYDTWPLVLRGDAREGESAVAATIQQLGLDDNVIRVPRLPEREMPLLYEAAQAMVFPSLYEGIGIPVLEALACGCPSVVGDLPSVRESVGDAAVYFNSAEVDSIREAMAALQSSPALRVSLQARARARAREHFAARVIPHALSVYERTARGVE